MKFHLTEQPQWRFNKHGLRGTYLLLISTDELRRGVDSCVRTASSPWLFGLMGSALLHIGLGLAARHVDSRARSSRRSAPAELHSWPPAVVEISLASAPTAIATQPFRAEPATLLPLPSPVVAMPSRGHTKTHQAAGAPEIHVSADVGSTEYDALSYSDPTKMSDFNKVAPSSLQGAFDDLLAGNQAVSPQPSTTVKNPSFINANDSSIVRPTSAARCDSIEPFDPNWRGPLHTTAQIEIGVSKRGSVAFVHFNKSSGDAELDADFVASLSKQRFTPCSLADGAEIDCFAKYHIEFDVIRNHHGDLVASLIWTGATD